MTRDEPLRRAYDTLADQDAYAVLGVDPAADHRTLRRAYLRAMREHHPDRAAQSTMAVVLNAAWQVLQADRAGYDRFRRARLDAPHATVEDLLDAPDGEPAADPWAGAAAWDGRASDDDLLADADPRVRRTWARYERAAAKAQQAAARQAAARQAALRAGPMIAPPLILLAVLLVSLLVAVLNSGSDGGTASSTSRRSALAYPTGIGNLGPYGGASQYAIGGLPGVPTFSLPPIGVPSDLRLAVLPVATVQGPAGGAVVHEGCDAPSDACLGRPGQPWLRNGTTVYPACTRTGGWAVGSYRSNVWVRVERDGTTAQGWVHVSLLRFESGPTASASALPTCD